MKYSKLTQSRPTEVPIDVLGEPVKVTYDRSRINGAFWASERSWRKRLARLMVSWDLTDDDTKKVIAPAENTEEGWLALFEPIPDDLLLAIWNALFGDYNADPKASAGSTAT